MKTIGKLFSKLNTYIKNFNSVYTELRSDTKTLPTPKMIEYLQQSNFGDDNIEEDPTINVLSDKICKIFNKERALFVTSGTMGNIVGLGVHCKRDEYIIQGERSHLHKTELESQMILGYKQIINSDIDDNKYFNVKTFLSSKCSLIDINQIKAFEFENTHNYNGVSLLDVVRRIKNEKILNSNII
jgi:threonine aldolase